MVGMPSEAAHVYVDVPCMVECTAHEGFQVGATLPISSTLTVGILGYHFSGLSKILQVSII